LIRKTKETNHFKPKEKLPKLLEAFLKEDKSMKTKGERLRERYAITYGNYFL